MKNILEFLDKTTHNILKNSFKELNYYLRLELDIYLRRELEFIFNFEIRRELDFYLKILF